MDTDDLDEILEITKDVVFNVNNNFCTIYIDLTQVDSTETQFNNEDSFLSSFNNEDREKPKSYDEKKIENMEIESKIQLENSLIKCDDYLDYEEIKNQIYAFIQNNQMYYKSIYIKRLDDINDIYNNFYKYKHENHGRRPLFDPLNEKNEIDELNKIVFNFNENLELNQENCDKFLKEIAFKIFNDDELKKIDARLKTFNINRKKIIFFSELMKLYKHVIKIPELLTIGSLFSFRLHRKSIILTYQINFLLENIDHFEKKKIFCFMYDL